MAQQQRYIATPRIYEIGVDITQDAITELTLKLADWFVESRPSNKEPTVLARHKIRDCLEGLTADGKPWYTAASSTFEARIKMSCRFDMSVMAGIRTANEATKDKREKKKKRAAKAKLKARVDANIPDELRKDMQQHTKYGDSAQVFLTNEEHKRWLELRNAYQDQFHELRTINAEAELNRLCNLLIMDERQQLLVLQGKKTDLFDVKATTDMIVTLKKALNIHPDQVAKRSQDAQGGSVAEVAARLDAMGNAKDIRERFFVEEALQMYQMYHQPSPRDDAGGYQLDELGLFSLTRCRTCECPRCGSRNYVGISIDELETYLLGHGVLEVENPVQAHIDSAEEPDAGA